MPFHVVHFALAGGFLAVWGFIALTTLRDRLGEARAERLAESADGQPVESPPRGHARARGRRRRRRELARV